MICATRVLDLRLIVIIINRNLHTSKVLDDKTPTAVGDTVPVAAPEFGLFGAPLANVAVFHVVAESCEHAVI